MFGRAHWKVQLITFVGGTCDHDSVNAGQCSKNPKELQVVESMHDTNRKDFVHELSGLKRDGSKHQRKHQGMSLEDLLASNYCPS